MRVITGKAKGKRLKAPKGLSTRPTTDRVKESLFNIIGLIPEDSLVLDLFSGSGNVGIEFLSRGALECYFIDNDFNSIKIIKENLENTKFISQANVFKNSVGSAIKVLGKKSKKFHYIFMDPPYEKNLVVPSLESICDEDLLVNDGIVIIEHESKTELPDKIKNITTFDTRRYGDTTITFYKHEEEMK
ncbi:16S rRNA (guanine(966)-N(2))-methyltransferase RsmD [Sporosalibacterium faouarense]|uniref:16S rRNA (guanine(966)-N(2))-methyltransferase RsmD n=1 Tax=Sporosalibacterium faouarense TaxID=516123 RepID=UPI00141CF161|nr:16S rRNA (guanine(966)-N(2))-methyltransferase RsmD [Sporosalibacterium faouarense]MTI47712.1 16S rRNA (guanine(966)-N(2))-methyltransferase RsmD [Bacillota bacterium]